jgi:hypothetical protein
MGVRGIKLHQTLFGPELIPDDKQDDDLRGRDPELIQARNEHIFHRYLYWSDGGRAAYPWVISQLKREFYLSESRLGQIIDADKGEIARIKSQKLTEKQLNDKYPPPVWRKLELR